MTYFLVPNATLCYYEQEPHVMHVTHLSITNKRRPNKNTLQKGTLSFINLLIIKKLTSFSYKLSNNPIQFQQPYGTNHSFNCTIIQQIQHMEYKIQLQQFFFFYYFNLKLEWKLISIVDSCYTC